MTLAAGFMVPRGPSRFGMHTRTAALVIIGALALAGCTGGIEAAKKATPSTRPTMSTPTNSTTNDAAPPPASPPAPVQFATKLSHRYASPAESPTFRVPENATPGRITLRLAPDATAACVTADASIEVRSPSGELVASLKMPTPPPATSDACPPPVKVDRAALPAGEWSVRFAGTGSALGTVEIVPSGGL